MLGRTFQNETQHNHNYPHHDTTTLSKDFSSKLSLSTVTKTVSFPSYLAALIVGRKGYAINQLQQQSGATIHIPKVSHNTLLYE